MVWLGHHELTNISAGATEYTVLCKGCQFDTEQT